MNQTWPWPESRPPTGPRSALFSGRMRELLELLGALRDLDAAPTTPEGMRGALALIERLAALAGADAAALDWLRRVAADEALLAIVASIAAYLWRRTATRDDRTAWAEPLSGPDGVDDLPRLFELIELLAALQAGAK